MTFIISAISTEAADEARQSPFDAYGNALSPQTQSEPGNPCRHCLNRAKAGERLVLFSYSPFTERNPFKEVGPVFVHADGCPRYASAGAVPPDFLDRPLVLRGYDGEQQIARVAIVVDGQTVARIEELLADPGVAYVHARSFTHGCYLFRIDRP
ncbi:MAG TPA: DUF1203 domain-containing protein [Verrucomicrobiae bacterium]|nr:DUF1203 domain-containing protein [Verrucomicrobiae bacterium]